MVTMPSAFDSDHDREVAPARPQQPENVHEAILESNGDSRSDQRSPVAFTPTQTQDHTNA